MPDAYPVTPDEYEEYLSVMGASADDAEEYEESCSERTKPETTFLNHNT